MFIRFPKGSVNHSLPPGVLLFFFNLGLETEISETVVKIWPQVSPTMRMDTFHDLEDGNLRPSH